MEQIINIEKIKKSGIATYKANLELYNSGILNVNQFNDLIKKSGIVLKNKSEYTLEENDTEFIIRIKKNTESEIVKGFQSLASVGNIQVRSLEYIGNVGIAINIVRKF